MLYCNDIESDQTMDIFMSNYHYLMIPSNHITLNSIGTNIVKGSEQDFRRTI